MSNLKILTVDDSATMRRIIVNTLKRAGYSDVDEASDGKEALAKMKVDTYSLVITDWSMPVMDGLTFVTKIRECAEFANLPVLMVTTRSVKEDIIEAKRAGVTDYIVKPFTASTLAEKINLALNGPNKT